MNLILIFLGASFWCFGFHVVMVKVVLAEIMGIDLDNRWDSIPRIMKLIIKPLYACPYCMASIHGAVICASEIGFKEIPIFCICLCGFNYLLSQFINE